MLGSIILQIAPKLIRQGIAVVNVLLKDIFHDRLRFHRSQVESKVDIITITFPVKPNDQDTFTVLGNIILSVQYLPEPLYM